jgi:hypothetical protein
MVERGRGLRFLNEASQPILMSRDFAGQEFQSHGPAELCVLSAVDLTHTARTDFGTDAIVRNRSTGGKFCHS